MQRGEFVLSALPNGPYSVRIEMPGFKSYTTEGIGLGAGPTVRQTFVLELGTVAETVTVAGTAPLIETATSSASETLGSQEVRELPVNRRNVANLLSLAPGVSVGGSGGGMVSMNGVAGGGTAISVDGTEANSNPEGRAVNHYGGQNQISVMSLDSVEEVQIVKGVLPAEYGGVAGGQVNMISRSGTNAFRGTAFYNLQNFKWNARSFLSTTPKPVGTFNQYGGTLGGPIFRNRLFFFTTYEGYRENVQIDLVGNTPNQRTRDALLAALPFPETKIWLDAFPAPTEDIVSTAGVVDPEPRQISEVSGTRRRTENHVVAKGDLSVRNGANLAVTYTRMRPWTLIPRFFTNGANDQDVPNAQDRIAAQYVMTAGSWVSESRFGWNLVDLDRWDAFFRVMDPNPNAPPEVSAFARRVPWININNLFSGPDAEIFNLHNHTWSYDQKVSRGIDRHLLKMGFRWMRSSGNKLTAQNPQFQYASLADALGNIPLAVNASFGTPYYNAVLDEIGGFFQDDWRIGANLVLNLGVRYDYYLPIVVRPTTEVPAEAVNLSPATDLRKLDFGPQVDPLSPYDAGSAIAPRLGFAWTVPGTSETVVRGGVGVPCQSAYASDGAADNRGALCLVPPDLESNRCGGKRVEVSELQRPPPRSRHRRRRRAKSHLLGDRRTHRCALHDSNDGECPACHRAHDGGGNGVHTHERPGLPAAAAVCARARSGDRCDAQRRAARRAGWLLRGQQPDDGIQRVADVGPQAVLEPLLVRRQLHVQQGYGDPGGRPGCLLALERQQHPGFLESGARSGAGGQRSSPPCERDVHRRASRAGWTKSDRQGSRGRMAGVRHRHSALG